MRCTKCGTEGQPHKRFCAECGSPLPISCPKCGAENAAESKFCADCGTPLASGAQSVAEQLRRATSIAHGISIAPEQSDAALAINGERKTVTALFADIKGSMELLENLDPEEARAIVDPALKLMIGAVHHYGGYIVQSTGDGIFALFGAPVAHEDHPQRALYTALRIQEEMRRYAIRLREAGNLPIEARVGVNTGEVVVRSLATGDGHVEYTPIGHSTSLAARMQALAPSGSIATADATRRLCEGYFTFKPLGPARVKGVSDPVNIHEVTGLGALRTHFQLSLRRGLTKFVGREREMAEMRRALELACGGHGQVVAVVAEAGAGKSRLVYEFKRLIPNNCMILEAYSVSHGKASPYQPVLELLYGYFGIDSADDKATRRSKIETRLDALDPGLREIVPYLFALLGIQDTPDPLAQMDLQIRRRRTLEALKRIALRESLNQPLIIIVEDLHWIDSETQALLDLLAGGVANARVLLLVNYRPEYRHEWGNRSYYTQLRLDPLGRESAAEVLSALLGDSVELNALKRLITEGTEGNPFFIEEMVQALFEEGALIRNGTVKIARSLSQLRLPLTVQALLASRIDRLPLAHKELLQTLAIIGRESPLGLIRKIASPAEGELDEMLTVLQAGEFIFEQPTAVGVEYVFKHALTREVAYNSLLIERRKQLHERTGGALEILFADRLDDKLDELTYHYRTGSGIRRVRGTARSISTNHNPY